MRNSRPSDDPTATCPLRGGQSAHRRGASRERDRGYPRRPCTRVIPAEPPVRVPDLGEPNRGRRVMGVTVRMRGPREPTIRRPPRTAIGTGRDSEPPCRHPCGRRHRARRPEIRPAAQRATGCRPHRPRRRARNWRRPRAPDSPARDTDRAAGRDPDAPRCPASAPGPPGYTESDRRRPPPRAIRARRRPRQSGVTGRLVPVRNRMDGYTPGCITAPARASWARRSQLASLLACQIPLRFGRPLIRSTRVPWLAGRATANATRATTATPVMTTIDPRISLLRVLWRLLSSLGAR